MVCLDKLSSLAPKQSFLSVSTISCIPSLTEWHYPGRRNLETWDSASVPSSSPYPVSLQNTVSLLNSPPTSSSSVPNTSELHQPPWSTSTNSFSSILRHLSVCSQTCIWWGYLPKIFQWLPTACRMKTSALASTGLQTLPVHTPPFPSSSCTIQHPEFFLEYTSFCKPHLNPNNNAFIL